MLNKNKYINKMIINMSCLNNKLNKIFGKGNLIDNHVSLVYLSIYLSIYIFLSIK